MTAAASRPSVLTAPRSGNRFSEGNFRGGVIFSAPIIRAGRSLLWRSARTGARLPPAHKIVTVPSCDGRALAAGSQDGTVTIWYIDSQRQRELSGASAEIERLAFGQLNSKRLLAALSSAGKVTVWHVDSLESAV